jgi:hypothetical protein
MIVAQITDAHVALPGIRLFGGYEPGPALRRVLAALGRCRIGPTSSPSPAT